MTHALILVIDDDHEEQIIFKEVFSEQNYHSVLYFDSAQGALAYLTGLHSEALFPKLIISDINMPKMSGIELLQQIRSTSVYKGIHFVMLSTANKREYGEACSQLGALEFIQKPDTFAEMKNLARYFTALANGVPQPPFQQKPLCVTL